MSLHLILHRPSAKYGSCTQFPSPPLQIFSEVLKLKILERKEKEDSIPPLGTCDLVGPVYIELWPLATVGATVNTSGLPGEVPDHPQPTINSVIPPLLLNCLERMTNLLSMNISWCGGEGSANERYTDRNAFSKAALGKGRKAALMKNMYLPCPLPHPCLLKRNFSLYTLAWLLNLLICSRLVSHGSLQVSSQ